MWPESVQPCSAHSSFSLDLPQCRTKSLWWENLFSPSVFFLTRWPSVHIFPPLQLPFPSSSFSPPGGGFSRKFPHLLRLGLNGIPQAAFLPGPFTVKDDGGPPLGLHASLSSGLCPCVQLSNPLLPPSTCALTGPPLAEGRAVEGRTEWSLLDRACVETGSGSAHLLSAVRPQPWAAATEEVSRVFRGKKDKTRQTPRSSQRDDGAIGRRVAGGRKFCSRVFCLQPKLHKTFNVARLVFVVFSLQTFHTWKAAMRAF